ncbi:MAG: fibronectin type III domain-containing protein [Acidobacteria bacterium]|nr:fibronectin type III domain-containing protein [Acidobacteriota bacterium]
MPFSVDSVKLTAPDEVTLGATYTVRWSLADGDANGTRTARVFLDTDTNAANGATLIGQGIDAGAGAWQWPSSGVPPGLYYVYVEVTDTHGAATNTQGLYSTGLLRVLAPFADGAVISLLQPQSGGTFYSGYTLGGCAYHPAATSGSGIDEVIAYAMGGPTGTAINLLGSVPTGEWGAPLATGLPCPGGSGPSANSGFAVSNIFGLAPGNWTFRILARNTLTGDFDEALATNVLVDWRSPPARNLRLHATAGNGVTIAWDPPDGGRPVTAYRIEVGTNPSFVPLAAHVQVPVNVTSGSGTLPNGTWFVRIITESAYTNAGHSSNVLNLLLPGGIAPGPVGPPGAPTLSVVQSQVNPITLSWAAGAGGAPSQYVLLAGTAPGASNLGAFNVTGQSGVTAPAPTGARIYVRLVASNAAGSATSNEISFTVGGATPPGAPTMNPASVSGRSVTLSWSSGAGATSYIVVARVPGSSAIVATLPGQTATSAFVPNVPPGSYQVSVVAVNAAGPSAESNVVTVNVP